MQLEIQHWVKMIWIAILVVWIIGAFSGKQTVRRDSLSSRLFHLSLVALVFLLITNPRLNTGPLSMRFVSDTLTFSLFGLALTIAGVAFAIWARVIIGRNWSAAVTVKQGHELVRRGPYSVVRHPIYTGVLVGLLGTVVTLGDVRWLLAFFVVSLALWLKSRREESFMMDQFGAEYVAYRSKVKALIPFVW